MRSAARPVRGSRPSNRRELILDAATELFAARGYEAVNVADVAVEVAVAPSALYRYFRSKESLLEAVLERAGNTLSIATRSDAEDLEQALHELATSAMDLRPLGALYQREAKHLPAPARRHIDAVFATVRHELGERVAAAVPDITQVESDYISVAVLGAILSPWVHRVDIARPHLEDLVTQLALRVVNVPAMNRPRLTTSSAAAVRAPLGRSSRREVILRAALDLFAESTFASVSMNDIAAAAGLASASVYHHFASKMDLLSIALKRGDAYLQLSLERILYSSTEEAAALRELVASYSHFAFSHPTIIDLLITEARNLPVEDHTAITQSQREYVNEWVHLYRRLNPKRDEAEATVIVQGVLMIINDLARLPGLQHRPDVEHYASELAAAGLLLDGP
ncbi:TetR/AcrR family transcriptional regulator [Amycolatopsis pithecellobii]|uniref:TetR family transcriptional regulator n=1 Tax=Amycolatopsis pithecellobii TaxID=664692 RepID=A0A6N7Z8G7_9PSEU|nr:TetR/AcrR family transcriptional regulator [Amycolatopsis pithecellobii]MTD57994.1 TetR family transcriptional regulator [Amycolatopsis pithecellobii]